jgi:hypothetical protein
METTSVPEDGAIRTGTHRLHYLDWSNPGTALMVLLRGLCTDAHYWGFWESVELHSTKGVRLDGANVI